MFQAPDAGRFGGSDSGPGPVAWPPSFKLPIAPIDVEVVVDQVGIKPSFHVSWTDETVIQPATPTVGNWQVRYVDEKIAGSISNQSDFPTRALTLSRYLNTVATESRGSRLTYNHTEANMKDGYVIVIGISPVGPIGGPPSMPWLVRLQASSKAVPPDIMNQGGKLYIETYNGSEYFNFAPGFRAPADDYFFRGMQVYWNKYITDNLSEMGNTDIYVGSSPSHFQTSPFRRFPSTDNLALGRGTLSSVSGDPNVEWVSGDTFDGGWPARPIYIQWAGRAVYEEFLLPGGWPVRNIMVVSDSTHMLLDDNANDTGTFNFYVLKPLTMYYVAVSGLGTRRDDLTGAPAFNL